MAPRMIDADGARGMLESFSVECDDCDGAGHYPCPVCGHANDEQMCEAGEPDFVQHDDSRHIRCELCDGRGVVSDDDNLPDADIVIDLAHTVIGLHEEVARLREAIEGRTTPPTDAEIAAHSEAGGRWRCVVPRALHLCADAMHGAAASGHRDTLIAAGHDSLWWALDERACPWVWPVVEAQKGGNA